VATAQPGISPAAKGMRRCDSKGASPLLSVSPQGQPYQVGLAAISTKYIDLNGQIIEIVGHIAPTTAAGKSRVSALAGI